MPNYGTFAICPYFSTEDPTAIKCEGIVQLNQIDSVYLMRFKNKDRKKEWIKKYCESYQYDSCPYAAILQEKYGGKVKSIREIIKEVKPIGIHKQVIRVKKVKDIKGQLELSFTKGR